MAKKATSKSRSGSASKGASKSTALVTRSGSDRRTGGDRRSADGSMGDAFIKLLQSPLVAELVAVAATSALAAVKTLPLRSTTKNGIRACRIAPLETSRHYL